MAPLEEMKVVLYTVIVSLSSQDQIEELLKVFQSCNYCTNYEKAFLSLALELACKYENDVLVRLLGAKCKTVGADPSAAFVIAKDNSTLEAIFKRYFENMEELAPISLEKRK